MARKNDPYRSLTGMSCGPTVDVRLDYPEDLLRAQGELDHINGALMGLLGSRPAGAVGSRRKTTGMGLSSEASDPARFTAAGEVTSYDAARVARLRARGAELIRVITGHHFWAGLDAADVSAAWAALQHRRAPRHIDEAAG